MNQQQRAGKHPSFSRDRKPPGLRRETFLKRPEVPKPKERKRKEKKKASTALTFAFSASSELDSGRNNGLFSLIHKKWCERQKSDRTHDILGCFKALALLGVEPVCQETVDACLAVCGNPSWAKTFLAGHFKKARGYLLHVAVHEATVSENFDLISRLLPQILDRKLVMCTLSTAASVLTDDSQLFLRFVRSVYGMKEKSTDLCVKEALGLKEWLLLTRLLKAWHPARRATEAIAEAAITAAQWELVKLCVGHGVDKALRNRALAEALKSGQWDTVLEFFQRGDNIAEACAENGFRLNDRVFCGRTILHDAIVCKRSAEVMELLLQAGADPDVADTFGETAFHAAVKRGFWSLLRLLLRYSKAAGKIASTRIQKQQAIASLITAYRRGRTLLHVLCEEGQEDIVELLLQAGADPDVADTLGETALHAAVKHGFWSLLRLLLRYSNEAVKIASTRIRQHRFMGPRSAYRAGRTLLHVLCEKCEEGLADIVELLLQAGADPDAADTLGETALHAAVKHKDWSLLRLLLRYSKAAGKIASTRIQQKCTEFMWLRPAYRGGSTLLHALCEEGQADIVHTLLLMTGADPLVRDDNGKTLMMAASEAAEGRENVYRALIQSGISTHQPIVSASLLASLKERKSDVDEAFSSPMKRAVERGQLRIAKMLYASGACSNREVHELSTSPTIRLKARRDVLEFVEDISSQPRRLRDLCSLTVSHLIGCGAGRDDRAARAGLPPPVRRQVLLEHVTNPEFLNDCPPSGCGAGLDDSAARASLHQQVLLQQVAMSRLLNVGSPVLGLQHEFVGLQHEFQSPLEFMLETQVHLHDFYRPFNIVYPADLVEDFSMNFHTSRLCSCATTRRPVHRCSCRIKPE